MSHTSLLVVPCAVGSGTVRIWSRIGPLSLISAVPPPYRSWCCRLPGAGISGVGKEGLKRSDRLQVARLCRTGEVLVLLRNIIAEAIRIHRQQIWRNLDRLRRLCSWFA